MIILFRIIVVLINWAFIFYVADSTTKSRDSLNSGLLTAALTGSVFTVLSMSIFVFTGTLLALITYIGLSVFKKYR